jgi:hypothetical protein
VRSAGLNLTPIRANALRLIADAGRPVKAYELLDRMKATHEGAAPPTVYRALDFLLENGFIHKLASINAYRRLPPSRRRSARGAVPDLRHVPLGDRTGGRRIVSALDAARARWASRRRRRRSKCTASARTARGD